MNELYRKGLANHPSLEPRICTCNGVDEALTEEHAVQPLSCESHTFREYSTSPFYIPPTNTVVQLSSSGEMFHARTKVWKGYVPYLSIPGVRQRSKDANSLLSSALSQDELIKRFNACKSRAINLR